MNIENTLQQYDQELKQKENSDTQYYSEKYQEHYKA